MAGNATTVARLRFTFEGDLKGYRDSLRTAKAEGDAAAKTMGASLRSSIGSLGTTIFKDLKDSPTKLKDIRTELGQVGGALKQAFSSTIHKSFNAGLGVIRTSLNGLKGAIGQIGKGFALGIGFTGFQVLGRAISDLVGAIPDLIKRGQEYIRIVDDTADSTGAATEETAKFIGILQYLGVPTNGVINMIGQMSRNLDLMRPKLEAVGVATRDANGGTLNQIAILENARKAFHEFGVGTTKANLIAREFGRGGLKTLVDYLNMTDEQAKLVTDDLAEMGLIITDQQRDLGESMIREQARLNNVFTGFGVQLFTAVGPSIRAFISNLTDWIKTNMGAIKTAIAETLSFLMGLVSGLLGMSAGLNSFSGDLQKQNAVLSPYNAHILETDVEIANLTAKMKMAKNQVNGTNDALKHQIATLDDQIKALADLVKAEDRVYAARMKNIRSIIDEKLAMLDAAEAARELARQQYDLNEQLNQAQIDLAKAQRGEQDDKTGAMVVNAENVAKAMADVADAQRAISDLAHEQEVAAQRKTLTNTQAYIDNVTKLVEDAENRKAVAKTLGRKQTALQDELALAKEKGDLDAVAIIQAKLDAVNLGIEQVNSRIRTDLRAAELARKKEMLQEAATTVENTLATEMAALKKELKALEEQDAGWQLYQRAIGKVKDVLGQLGIDSTTILGDPKGPTQGALDAAREKGVEVAQALKDAFEGFKTTLSGLIDTVGTLGESLGKLFKPLMDAWEAIPKELRSAILGALVGAKVGGPPGAVIGGIIGGAVPVIEEQSNQPGNGINIGAYIKAGDIWKEIKARLGRLPTMAEIETAFGTSISVAQQRLIVEFWKGKGMIQGWAAGGIIGARGPQLGMFGERGVEFVLNNSAVRALTQLNRSPVTALAAVAGGSSGSPAVIRLEIGGRPLLDYVDENLVYRRRI